MTLIWESQQHSLAMFFWVALKENVRLARILWIISESRISAGATEKLPETKATGKPDAEKISSWSYDMEGHAKKCVEYIANLRIKHKQLSNFSKSRRHIWKTTK